MTRYLLLAVALVTGAYAVGAWMFGLLTDAGVAGATSAAAVLMAEFVTHCQRGRMRAGREQVWARREVDLRAQVLIDAMEREPHRPVWDFSTGAPE